MLFDPPSILNNWYGAVKQTQINKSRSIFFDRMSEIEDYFGVSSAFLLKYFIKNGLPGTDKFKNHYLKSFMGNVTPEKLKYAYDRISFDYTLRLMLAYERYSLIIGYLDYIQKDSDMRLDELNILDYGCGAADIGLLFCTLGANVTLCDLDNTRFDFVVYRFTRRGYEPGVIKILNTESYPELPENFFDLIIATELFEHVRDPLQLLENFIKSLKNRGYLFDSMAGKFERDDRPHHLKEAFEIGKSEKYQNFYKRNFKQLFPGDGLKFLFKKR